MVPSSHLSHLLHLSLPVQMESSRSYSHIPSPVGVVGRLISLSGTEEIMQNLVKRKHSCPICEFLDDILGFARLKPNLTLSQTGSGSKSYLTASMSQVVNTKHLSTYKHITRYISTPDIYISSHRYGNLVK